MNEVDHTLRRQVSEVQDLVLRVERGVGQVGTQVAQVGQRAEETHDRLTKLAQEFTEFVAKSERARIRQIAETRIVAVEARLEHEFGHYNVVRRTATGVLQGFDVGLISEETVRDVSEELTITTPGYWLAPVVVALAAWAADDADACERAIQEAFRRSPSKTSLFMALVLRRQGRMESSVRWLRHYLAALDPNALGREFAVILESVSHGAFGPGGVQVVQERLDVWRTQLLGDESLQQAQVDRWRVEVDRHVGQSSRGRFPRLAEHSPQWSLMDRALARAGAHEALIATYSAMAAEEATSSDRIEDQIDDILDRLVKKYDDVELPLRREHAEHQAVVRHDGDEVAARRDLDTDLTALDKTLDYLTIQSESALNPEKLGVSRATQRMAVSSCHEWFAQAHAAFSRDYRGALPVAVNVEFEGSHNTAGTVFKLPRWTGSFTQPMEELERSLALHWDRAAGPFIDNLAYKWGKNLIAPISVTVVALICFGAAWPFGIVLVLLGALVWGLVLWNQQTAAVRRQQEVRQMLDRAKRDSLQQLRGAGAEVVDWTAEFRRADILEPAVRTLIADLATAGNTATPYERRVADPGASIGV